MKLKTTERQTIEIAKTPGNFCSISESSNKQTFSMASKHKMKNTIAEITDKQQNNICP